MAEARLGGLQVDSFEHERRSRGASERVKAESFDPGCSAGRYPNTVAPVRVPERAAIWRGENKCLRVGTGKDQFVTKAAVWIRVSTTHQVGDNQVLDLERFAEHHGYEIVHRYQVSESAWNGGTDVGEYRATMRRALDDAWQGEFGVLIVWALDRITREGAEGALRTLRQFRERGCTVVSVKESWLNGSPEIQDVLVAFAGWVAQQESQRRSERVKAGLARRKAEGKPIGGAVSRRGKDRKPRKTDGYRRAWARRREEEAPTPASPESQPPIASAKSSGLMADSDDQSLNSAAAS